MGIGKGSDAKHIHHAVEAKRYQKSLNIPREEWDDVPGFVIDGVEHNGPGGLTHRLYQVLGDTKDPNAIIAGHRQVHRDERGLNDLWKVTEKWFIERSVILRVETSHQVAGSNQPPLLSSVFPQTSICMFNILS